jgi:hypothetical protein
VRQRSHDFAKLMRWYLAQWREPYGDESMALTGDRFDANYPTQGLRVSFARSGHRERAHQTGPIANSPRHINFVRDHCSPCVRGRP